MATPNYSYEKRQRELAKFVANHVLGNIDGNVLFTVMHRNCQADEVRQDRGAA